jgi:hypothetical protein
MVSTTSKGQSPNHRTQGRLPTVAGCSMLAPSHAHLAAHDCITHKECERLQITGLAYAAKKKAFMGLSVCLLLSYHQLHTYKAGPHPTQTSRANLGHAPALQLSQKVISPQQQHVAAATNEAAAAPQLAAPAALLASTAPAYSHCVRVPRQPIAQPGWPTGRRPPRRRPPRPAGLTARRALHTTTQAPTHPHQTHSRRPLSHAPSPANQASHRAFWDVRCCMSCGSAVSITGCFAASWPAAIPLRYLMCASCLCVHPTGCRKGSLAD